MPTSLPYHGTGIRGYEDVRHFSGDVIIDAI